MTQADTCARTFDGVDVHGKDLQGHLLARAYNQTRAVQNQRSHGLKAHTYSCMHIRSLLRGHLVVFDALLHVSLVEGILVGVQV